jgi:hypothetical protein
MSRLVPLYPGPLAPWISREFVNKTASKWILTTAMPRPWPPDFLGCPPGGPPTPP